MGEAAGKDQWVMIRVEGMHCHKCEEAVRKALSAKAGVHEVEVDFNSRLASVLYDPSMIQTADLISAVSDAGYQPISFTQSAGPNSLNNPAH